MHPPELTDALALSLTHTHNEDMVTGHAAGLNLLGTRLNKKENETPFAGGAETYFSV